MARKGLNIYKRKDVRWEARYIKAKSTQGKQQYGYLHAFNILALMHKLYLLYNENYKKD